MKIVFSKIIILLSVSVGVLIPVSVMADYMVCDDAGNCTIVHTSSTTSAPTSNAIQIPESSGNNQYSSPEYAKQMAEKAAAEEKGRKLQACGEKKARIAAFTNTYDTCNSTTQTTYVTSIKACPEAVQVDGTWGVKTKDGTTLVYSRTTAENAGAQCRADAEGVKASAFTNVCDKNYNAAKEAEGPLNQFCKDEGF